MSFSDSSPHIQSWVDKSALTELVAMLSSAVDRGDKELIAACYAEESHDDHGAFKGSGSEFAEFIAATVSLSPSARWHHLLGQSLFEIRGDEAWGETFFIFHSVDDAVSRHGFGRYVDYFQRIGSEWKLKYRRVVPDHTPEGDDIACYPVGTRDRDDPRYDYLRWPKVT